jgi:hypothetical protein
VGVTSMRRTPGPWRRSAPQKTIGSLLCPNAANRTAREQDCGCSMNELQPVMAHSKGVSANSFAPWRIGGPTGTQSDLVVLPTPRRAHRPGQTRYVLMRRPCSRRRAPGRASRNRPRGQACGPRP